ncbi:MAG: hypothetical protein D6798_20125 [Deltaproteobacteria bacterium]|nr:MAG: hypothetical protein D6798_20125 [Deltaproteobacteria bacterium]
MSETQPAEGLTIAVVGATGAVGRDLVATLERSALPVRELRLVAGRSSAGQTVDVGGRSHRVQVLSGEPGELPAFEGVQLAFLAVPPEVSVPLASALAEQGIMVVEIGGALAGRAPMVVPAVGIEALAEASRLRMASSPSAPTVVVATVVAALRDLVPESVSGTVLLSAGAAGRAGAEELSGQVVALFNQRQPPRRVFPTGLAFDLLPAVGTVPAADDDPLAGWSEAERRVAAEVATLVELPPPHIALSLAVAPLFSGVAASLRVALEADADLDEIRRRLEAGPTIRLAEPLAGPRRLVGRAGLYVGRLRKDPAGGAVHLWAMADNLRFAATGNAIAVATTLWREGML